jgi:hypothetical protein
VPARFRPLYTELDQELAGAEKAVLALPGPMGGCPLMAPSLYQASSVFGPAEQGTQRWKDIMTELDGFQALGANAVSLMISFPNLTAGVKDPEPLLKFYELLAAEIRARKMKLLVEHFVYPSFVPTAEGKFVAGIRNLPDPKGAFLGLKRKEAELILSRVKPDYFSLITEPETNDRFLGTSITPEDYAVWLDSVTAGLPRADGTKIGAGAGVWESERYVAAFARIKGLDYIDIHFYPMKLGSEEFVPKFLKLAGQIRSADPSKGLMVSEAWLYKHAADEPKGVFNTEAYGRNAYDFWAPLDARFFELMNDIGRKEGISVIAPYFPQFFFITQKFDPAISPDWPASMTGEWQRALGPMRERAFSGTGDLFRSLEGKCVAR